MQAQEAITRSQCYAGCPFDRPDGEGTLARLGLCVLDEAVHLWRNAFVTASQEVKTSFHIRKTEAEDCMKSKSFSDGPEVKPMAFLPSPGPIVDLGDRLQAGLHRSATHVLHNMGSDCKAVPLPPGTAAGGASLPLREQASFANDAMAATCCQRCSARYMQGRATAYSLLRQRHHSQLLS